MQTVALWLAPLAMVMVSQTGQADPVVPLLPQPTEWISGPRTAALGEVGEIRVPQGYKFTDTEGARSMLERMNNPVPRGLVGIMVPEVGGGMVIIEYTPTGYVRDQDQKQMDQAAMLAGLRGRLDKQNAERARGGAAPITSLDWEIKPEYDAGTRTLEWAVVAKGGTDGIVNHTVRLLGRKGVLDAIAVRPANADARALPLKQLARNLAFKEGNRYGDYRQGDKLASATLATLITTDISADAAKEAARAGMRSLWIGLAIGLVCLCCLALAGTAFMKSLRNRRQVAQANVTVAAPASVPQPAPVPAAQAEASTPAAVAAPRPAAPASKPAAAVPVARTRPSTGKSEGGSHRKRVFDYNRYFADLMSNVSSNAMPSESMMPNGYARNGSRPAASPGPEAKAPAQSQAASIETHAEMLAHQKALIEDQRRLIQEQTKLIEEKTKLIAEKNQLLKMQSELIDNNML